MSRRDDTVRLRHMLDAARKACVFTEGLTLDVVRSDEIRSLALVRLLEIVGEAARAVSSNFQKQHSEIPWAGIVGLRNRLIHGYDDVDLEVLWEVIKDELPTLIDELEGLVGKDPE